MKKAQPSKKLGLRLNPEIVKNLKIRSLIKAGGSATCWLPPGSGTGPDT
jgi:hypothetical protein